MIETQDFSSDGTPLGFSNFIAQTHFGRLSPPNLTVSDDGSQTAICWEDYGIATNRYGSSCAAMGQNGPLILCSTIDDDAGNPVASYSGCGNLPELIYDSASLPLDPDAGALQLYYLGASGGQVWTYGDDPGISINWGGSATSFTGAPVAAGWNALAYFADGGGLVAELAFFAEDGWYSQRFFETLDPSFASGGQLAATSELSAQILSVLELDDAGLRATSWQFDGGAPRITPIATSVAPTGPLGAAACPDGFAYLTMIDGAVLLLTEAAFDGGLLSDAGGSFILGNFGGNVASMAVAPNLDGGILLAVSNPGQMAVYLVPCR